MVYLTDIKLFYRRLTKYPLISAVSMGGLALGIACAYLALTYADQEFGFEKSFTDYEKTYRVGVDFMDMGGFAVAPEILHDYMDTRSAVVETSTRVKTFGEISLQKGQKSVKAMVMGVDSTFFELFDYPLVFGKGKSKLFDPGQAVVSKSFAQKWFGTFDVIGEEIELPFDGIIAPYLIAAVVNAENVSTHMIGDIWVPIQPLLDHEKSWYSAAYYTYFKLKSNKDEAVFRQELHDILKNEIYASSGKVDGLTFGEWKKQPDAYRFIVQPLADIHLQSQLNFELSAGGNRAKVNGFLIIGFLILLIAIANYINLATARSFIRSKEIGIKKSVGAARGQLLAQLMATAGLEAIIIGVVAITFMQMLGWLLNTWITLPLLESFRLRPGSLLSFSVFVMTVVIIAAAYPSFYLSSAKPFYLVKGNKIGQGEGGFRNALIVVQFIITTGLIFGSLVIHKQLKYLSKKDLGFDRSGLLIIDNMNALGSSAQTFQQELSAHPLVSNSSFAQSLPGSSSIYQSSYRSASMARSIPIRTLPVDAAFIPTMGIKLLRGENFRNKLTPDSSVAIINESAQIALGLDNPIGVEIGKGRRIIGVVSDFHIESLKQGIQPIVLTHDRSGNHLAMRLEPKSSENSLESLLQTAERLWSEFEPNASLQYGFIDDTFAKYAKQEQVQGKGILALTVMAIFLACLGLFGLTTFTMQRRQKEVSIRKILGASAVGLMSLLSRDFLKLVALALLISLPFAWYIMNHWLQDFAYRIEISWPLFLFVTGLVLTIATMTTSIQSLKVTMSNPVNALKDD